MPTGINGAHVLLYSDNPEADRAFFRDILNFPAVDAGGGWLIFALPPAEVGIHPSDGEKGQSHGGRKLLGSVLYLMCDNLPALMKSLQSQRRDLLARGRGRLGNQDHDPVAQRRRNRSLSAHSSDSPWSWVASFNGLTQPIH